MKGISLVALSSLMHEAFDALKSTLDDLGKVQPIGHTLDTVDTMATLKAIQTTISKLAVKAFAKGETTNMDYFPKDLLLSKLERNLEDQMAKALAKGTHPRLVEVVKNSVKLYTVQIAAMEEVEIPVSDLMEMLRKLANESGVSLEDNP